MSLHRFLGLAFVLLAAPALARAQPVDLASALHLRADQAAAYAAYEHATAPDPVADARRIAESRQVASMHTPERLDWTIRQLTDDLALLQRQSAAVKALYAQLTPEQQAAFDDATAPDQDGR